MPCTFPHLIFSYNSQAFYPKNRGRWKQYSSWEPEIKEKKGKREVEDTRFLPDVQVKKGYTWSQQLGIAVACLVDAGQTALIDWTKEVRLKDSHIPETLEVNVLR